MNIFKLLLIHLLAFSFAHAKTARTHPYNGYGTTLRGDIRTLGMSGASVGLADNFASSIQNPAGAALTLEGSGLQLSHNEVRDGQIQSESEPLSAKSYGVILNEFPWGFALGEWRTYSEGERALPTLEVSEARFQASRLFLEDRKLSLGVALVMGQGREVIDQFFQADRDFGMSFGTQYLLDNRVVLGASYTTSMEFKFKPVQTLSTEVPDFFQPVRVPYRLGIGTGWIPNRFLRLGLSVEGIGPTEEGYLLADDFRQLGKNFTLQPRAGLVYQFVDIKNFEGSVAGGSHYEISRLEKAENRLHLTAGLELKPYVFTLGAALDHAPRYKNAILTFGVDVVLLMSKLKLIHPTSHPPQGGWLPDPFVLRDEGLDRALVKNYQQKSNPGLIENVRDFPENLQKRIEETPQDIQDLFRGMTD